MTTRHVWLRSTLVGIGLAAVFTASSGLSPTRTPAPARGEPTTPEVGRATERVSGEENECPPRQTFGGDAPNRMFAPSNPALTCANHRALNTHLTAYGSQPQSDD